MRAALFNSFCCVGKRNATTTTLFVKRTTKPEFEEGSGNVFADLGLDDSDELFARAKIGFHVHTILKEKNLAKREIASLLGIKQPEVSHLMNGHFSRFTTDKLLDFFDGSIAR